MFVLALGFLFFAFADHVASLVYLESDWKLETINSINRIVRQ